MKFWIPKLVICPRTRISVIVLTHVPQLLVAGLAVLFSVAVAALQFRINNQFTYLKRTRSSTRTFRKILPKRNSQTTNIISEWNLFPYIVGGNEAVPIGLLFVGTWVRGTNGSNNEEGQQQSNSSHSHGLLSTPFRKTPNGVKTSKRQNVRTAFVKCGIDTISDIHVHSVILHSCPIFVSGTF